MGRGDFVKEMKEKEGRREKERERGDRMQVLGHDDFKGLSLTDGAAHER